MKTVNKGSSLDLLLDSQNFLNRAKNTFKKRVPSLPMKKKYINNLAL